VPSSLADDQPSGLVALVGVGLTASGLAVHALLMALAIAVSYRTGALTRSGMQWVVVPLVAGTSAAALTLAVPPLRTALVTPVLHRLRSFRRTVIELAEQPGRLARLAAGSFVVTASHVAAMMAALAAVGVTMNPAAAAVAYLVGAAVAAPAPTPGGIGVVEAVLTSAYVNIGVEAAPALTAVLLFRLVTFWLPLLPGWASLTILTRRGPADRDGIAG
jgi:uncharacterized membrane protein YbhN (UPF0104 family)